MGQKLHPAHTSFDLPPNNRRSAPMAEAKIPGGGWPRRGSFASLSKEFLLPLSIRISRPFNVGETWNLDYVFRYVDAVADVDDYDFFSGLPIDNLIRKNLT